MTRHALLLSAILFVASPAAAGGPPIAYSKGSSTSELYLANETGGGTQLLYRAPTRKKIFGIAIRPGGNELAFEEVDCCSWTGTTTLKIVSYGNNGVRTGTRSMSIPCRISSLDYHPRDGRLLMVSGCNGRLSILNTATLASSDIVTGKQASKASWASDSRIFLAASAGLWTFDTSAPSALTKVAEEDAVQTADAAADGSRGLVGVADPGQSIKLVPNLNAGATLSVIAAGTSPSLSPDASQFAYITRDSRGQYIRVRPVTTTTGEMTIAAKAAYASVAWAGAAPATSQQTDFGIRTP